MTDFISIVFIVKSSLFCIIYQFNACIISHFIGKVKRKAYYEAGARISISIKGHTLEFHSRNGSAVATIVPREDSRVPAVLWEISERDERNLDRYEGFLRLYFKQDFRVFLGKRKVSAFAYIMSSGYDIGIPSEYYYNVILEGYTDNGIDTKPLFAALFNAHEHCSVR